MGVEIKKELYEVGSFEWYENIDSEFFQNLTRAMMHADNDNTSKIEKIFPHISSAKKESDWRSAPKTDVMITINNDDPERKLPERKSEVVFGDGSFNKYLYQSGHFLTFLSRAIFFADDNNMCLIGQEFPQMVIARTNENWDVPPLGFKNNHYLSEMEDDD